MDRGQTIALNGLASRPSWFVLLRMHAQQHKLVAMGLALALLGVIVLFGQSITQVLAGNAAPGLRLALYGGVAGFATTALGALPALLMRRH